MQVDALLDDRRVCVDEMQARHVQDEEKIKELTDQLYITQSMLYDCTKDYLDLKYEHRANERQWMVEKDLLLQQLDYYQEQTRVGAGVDPTLGRDFADSPQQVLTTCISNKNNIMQPPYKVQMVFSMSDVVHVVDCLMVLVVPLWYHNYVKYTNELVLLGQQSTTILLHTLLVENSPPIFVCRGLFLHEYVAAWMFSLAKK